MRIPFARRITGTLRTLRGPRLFRKMVQQSVLAEPTLAPALIVAPHADDETFGCGGIIALKRRSNVPVTIAILTNGAASHPQQDPAELIRTRQAEALTATAILGVPADEVFFLDAPDGAMQSLPADRRRDLIGRLADLLTAKRPAEVYLPHRHDHHPDHEAASALAREAIERAGIPTPTLLEYPIWLLWWAPLNQPASQMNLTAARRIPLGPAAEAKAKAIAAYQTQLPDMPRKFMDQFTGGFELFFRADPKA